MGTLNWKVFFCVEKSLHDSEKKPTSRWSCWSTPPADSPGGGTEVASFTVARGSCDFERVDGASLSAEEMETSRFFRSLIPEVFFWIF